MRSLEAISLLIHMVTCGWMLVFSGYDKKKALMAAGICSLASLIQLSVEGYRWQMIPVYMLSVFLWSYAFKTPSGGYTYKKISRIRRTGLFVFFCFYVMFAAALPLSLPVFTFEKPSGPYAVGRTTHHLVDSKRTETMTEDPSDARELMVHIWYPAAPPETGVLTAPYIPDLNETVDYFSKKYSIPRFVFSYLQEVRTHAYPMIAAAEAEAPYPVVVLSHGLLGTGFTSTFQAEELASHGYIVVGIQHTFFAPVTVFPEHRIVPAASNLPSPLDLAGWDRTIPVWVQDQRFVIDQLERLNTDAGILTGKMDTLRIGVLGHSFGGAAAAQTMAADPRVKAGVNMDGTPFGKDLLDGLKQPFLQFQVKDPNQKQLAPPNDAQLAKLGLTRAEYENFVEEISNRTRNMLQDGGYLVTISGATHMNFTDYFLWSPLLRWMNRSDLSPERAREIINAYTIAFFNQTLKNAAEPLLEANHSIFPEASIERE
jgi:predicted dienelactone hydrolase